MKLSDFNRVADLVDVKRYLTKLKDEGRIEISIDGAFQSRSFVDTLEASVRLELRHRIRDVDEQLLDLGVMID